jgi:hypothetical protein
MIELILMKTVNHNYAQHNQLNPAASFPNSLLIVRYGL